MYILHACRIVHARTRYKFFPSAESISDEIFSSLSWLLPLNLSAGKVTAAY